jgi:hypothetical protein
VRRDCSCTVAGAPAATSPRSSVCISAVEGSASNSPLRSLRTRARR